MPQTTTTRDIATQLQRDWLQACEQVGLPAITLDTCARLFAIVYVHGGGEEEMVLNRKFTNDVQYIQRRFHIQGGERPDPRFVSAVQGYVSELEQYIRDCTAANKSDTHIPEWAHRLMRDRYGMKLHG